MAEGRRRKFGHEDRRRRAVPRKHLVGDQVLGHSFGPDLVGRPTKGQGVGLGHEVCHQQVLAVNRLVVVGQRTGDGDQVDRDHVGSLVEELEEGVLGVSSRSAPDHRPGGSLRVVAVLADALAEAFHRDLLDMGGEESQAVGVGDDGQRSAPEEAPVPDIDEG